jgi:hypothetical protein
MKANRTGAIERAEPTRSTDDVFVHAIILTHRLSLQQILSIQSGEKYDRRGENLKRPAGKRVAERQKARRRWAKRALPTNKEFLQQAHSVISRKNRTCRVAVAALLPYRLVDCIEEVRKRTSIRSMWWLAFRS